MVNEMNKNKIATIRTFLCVIFFVCSVCGCSMNNKTTSADHLDCFVTPEGNKTYWCFDHEVSVALKPKE
jgi:hypothetical protein|tara:strand:- start:684 stop:890 length:207 start_codon:yes stop_codon:yes gene_type:complete